MRRIWINNTEVLREKGPLLLASNHPNSFLDGMIITTLFHHPVHSLARGDAFKRKWIESLLRNIQLLPVYRTSEGTENLNHNYATFAACQKTFEKKEIVLIFSEGRCENEWHLRSLKKGTARLAITAWDKGLRLKVIPTAINYSSFRKFGKEVHLHFGQPIDESIINEEETEGKKILMFNELLNEQLEKMVYEIDPSDIMNIEKTFSIQRGKLFFLLLIPGLTGTILHAPLYFPCKWFTEWKFKNNNHYDSMLTSLLLIIYPLYLILFSIIVFTFDPLYSFLAFIILPFTAWCAVQAKYELGI